MIHRDPLVCIPLIRDDWPLDLPLTLDREMEPWYEYWLTWNLILEKVCRYRYPVEGLSNHASFVERDASHVLHWKDLPNEVAALAINYGYGPNGYLND